MAQKILVLDDEANYAEMLEALLEQHFFVVDSATKPELALKALEHKGYDLVISDYKMPVMDGADFLQKAREINPELPFIIVSGLMNTPELVKVANMGVTLVLEKPIDINNFINQVKKFVQPLSEAEFTRQHKAKEDINPGGRDLASRRFIKTYPDGSPFVSDISPVMQFFLQDLWDALQEQAHVFISLPPGSEIDLLLAEVTRWKRPDGGGQPLYLEVGNRPQNCKALFEAYASQADGVGIVGLGGFAGASLASQERLVDEISEAPESLIFVYFFEQGLLESGESKINPELLELTRESLCVMPSLNERPSDLASYLTRYLPRLSQVEKGRAIEQVDADAIPLLLGYRWPGNFAELLLVLRRALASESADVLRSATLQMALEGVVSLNGSFGLEAGLLERQTVLLNRAQGEGRDNLMGLLESLGIHLENRVKSPEMLPLLYPELIQRHNP